MCKRRGARRCQPGAGAALAGGVRGAGHGPGGGTGAGRGAGRSHVRGERGAGRPGPAGHPRGLGVPLSPSRDARPRADGRPRHRDEHGKGRRGRAPEDPTWAGLAKGPAGGHHVAAGPDRALEQEDAPRAHVPSVPAMVSFAPAGQSRSPSGISCGVSKRGKGGPFHWRGGLPHAETREVTRRLARAMETHAEAVERGRGGAFLFSDFLALVFVCFRYFPVKPFKERAINVPGPPPPRPPGTNAAASEREERKRSSALSRRGPRLPEQSP